MAGLLWLVTKTGLVLRLLSPTHHYYNCLKRRCGHRLMNDMTAPDNNTPTPTLGVAIMAASIQPSPLLA